MTRILPVAALATAFALGGGWLLTGPGLSATGALPGAAAAQDSTAEAEAPQVIEMVKDGRIVDCKSVATVLYVDRFLRERDQEDPR